MIVGIDLGTTNSAIGIFRDGKSELIPNSLGDFLTPSAVSITPAGEVLVGLAARERMGQAASTSAIAFKRWMGTDKLFKLHNKTYRAEELSAMVLRQLKDDAERYLGMPVTEAIITVPAYFNQLQRQATKHAGELAGLKVERLLNEPTAAGLAYGLQEHADDTTFLVFDLGGGTFDVSILEYFDGAVQVKASAGDTQLGGEDFVDVLMRLFIQKIQPIDENIKTTILTDEKYWRLFEQAKRELSSEDTTTIQLSVKKKDFSVIISRHDFLDASENLLQRLRSPIERALRDAQINLNDLSEVIMVGGSSRMPMMQQLVAKIFQRLPQRLINPDLAIAQGAAVQAGLKNRDAALDEIVLVDVMPYSLGIISGRTHNGVRRENRFSPIIERNMAVPISRVDTFITVFDNQQSIEVDIRQGESPIGTENIHLGKIEVPMPPLPAGHGMIEVRFTYDVNGLLVVDVTETKSQKKYNKVIKQNGVSLTDEQFQEALKKLENLKIHPRDQQINQYLMERAKRVYSEHLGSTRNRVQEWLDIFIADLESQDDLRIQRSRSELSRAIDDLDQGFRL